MQKVEENIEKDIVNLDNEQLLEFLNALNGIDDALEEIIKMEGDDINE